jgi:D-xylose transport system ATP-binding protein
VFKVADFINVLYLGSMVAQLRTTETHYRDVVGYITGVRADDDLVPEELPEEVIS